MTRLDRFGRYCLAWPAAWVAWLLTTVAGWLLNFAAWLMDFDDLMTEDE